MQEQLSASRAQVDSLQSDLANWEAAVAARDVELQNLQRALGKHPALLPTPLVLLLGTAIECCAGRLAGWGWEIQEGEGDASGPLSYIRGLVALLRTMTSPAVPSVLVRCSAF